MAGSKAHQAALDESPHTVLTDLSVVWVSAFSFLMRFLSGAYGASGR
jgi:hypothetical protein